MRDPMLNGERVRFFMRSEGEATPKKTNVS
jgi:hypothetical protein